MTGLGRWLRLVLVTGRLIATARELRRASPRGETGFQDGVETESWSISAADLVLDMTGERWSARVALRTLTLTPREGGGLTAKSFAEDAILLRSEAPA